MKIIRTAKDTEYLTVKEASDRLSIDAQTMRDHLSKGTFTTYKFKSLTLIKIDEVEKWKEKGSRK